MINDNPLMQESYYRDGRTSETERLDVATVIAPAPTRDYLAGALLVVGGALLGRAVIPYDYQLLEVLVIVACYIVSSRPKEA